MRPVDNHNAAVAATVLPVCNVRGSLLGIAVFTFLLLLFRYGNTAG